MKPFNELTLDEQMKQIRHGKDPKSVLRSLPKPRDINYSKGGKAPHPLRVNMYNNMGKISGVKNFIKDCTEGKVSQNDLLQTYKVGENQISKARKMPDRYLETMMGVAEYLGDI